MTINLEFVGSRMKRYLINASKKNILIDNLFCQGLLNAKGTSQKMKSHIYNPASADNVKRYVLAAYENVDAEISEQIKIYNVKPICKKGCSGCCDEYFYVSKGEYLVIRDYLLDNGIEIAEIKQKAIAKKQSLERFYPSEYAKLSQGNRDIMEAYNDNDIPKGFDNCIFQSKNICSIYSVRPIICRLFGISRSYAQCDKIKKKLRSLFTGDFNSRKVLHHTVDVCYDKRYMENIDYYMVGDKKIMFPPFPLFWWFASDITY